MTEAVGEIHDWQSIILNFYQMLFTGSYTFSTTGTKGNKGFLVRNPRWRQAVFRRILMLSRTLYILLQKVFKAFIGQKGS
jgi:hypothetical protein